MFALMLQCKKLLVLEMLQRLVCCMLLICKSAIPKHLFPVVIMLNAQCVYTLMKLLDKSSSELYSNNVSIAACFSAALASLRDLTYKIFSIILVFKYNPCTCCLLLGKGGRSLTLIWRWLLFLWLLHRNGRTFAFATSARLRTCERKN
jgi:hypothetical protein